jgi:hypothetical protein
MYHILITVARRVCLATAFTLGLLFCTLALISPLGDYAPAGFAFLVAACAIAGFEFFKGAQSG